MSVPVQYTPGPWHTGLLDGGDSDGELAVATQGNYPAVIVATLAPDVSRAGGDSHANARLIAAAPELLAALEAIVDQDLTYFKGAVMGDQISRAKILAGREAVAKAIKK